MKKEDDYIGYIILVEFDEDEKSILQELLDVLERHPGFIRYQFKQTLVLKFDELEIRVDSRKVYHHGKEIFLTYTEFEILVLLARNPGRVFSKDQIYDMVWKESYIGDYNIVTSHISHIREKIEDDPANPIYIQTVWGIGCRFNQKIGSVS